MLHYTQNISSIEYVDPPSTSVRRSLPVITQRRNGSGVNVSHRKRRTGNRLLLSLYIRNHLCISIGLYLFLFFFNTNIFLPIDILHLLPNIRRRHHYIFTHSNIAISILLRILMLMQQMESIVLFFVHTLLQCLRFAFYSIMIVSIFKV